MEVTDIRIRQLSPLNPEDNKMKGIVSVTFDDEFVVHDIKIIQGVNKLFIAMPSRKVEDGSYKDITHPIKSSFRDKVQKLVIARYEQRVSEKFGRRGNKKGMVDIGTVDDKNEDSLL